MSAKFPVMLLESKGIDSEVKKLFLHRIIFGCTVMAILWMHGTIWIMIVSMSSVRMLIYSKTANDLNYKHNINFMFLSSVYSFTHSVLAGEKKKLGNIDTFII
jgi:hypothetical protein